MNDIIILSVQNDVDGCAYHGGLLAFFPAKRTCIHEVTGMDARMGYIH